MPLVASIAVLLQITYIYSFGAALKTDPAWHERGTALHLALSLDSFVSPMGAWLFNYPAITGAVTRAIWWFEAFGPLLFFVPFWAGRMLGIALFAFMHIGIGLMMSLEMFSITMCVVLVALLPGEFWERAERWWGVGAKLERLFAHDRLQRARQVVERVLACPSPIAPDAGQHHRRLRKGGDWAASGFCALCLIYTLESNLGWLDARFWNRWMPGFLSEIGRTFRLVQGWRMFAPRPPVESGWPILAAKLENGVEVDLLRNGNGVDWSKPKRLRFEDYRWRRLLMNMWDTRYRYGRPYVADYLCRTWNANHPRGLRVVSYRFWFMRQRIALPGQPSYPVKKVLLMKEDRFGASKSAAKPASNPRIPPIALSTPKVRPLKMPSFIPPASPKAGSTPNAKSRPRSPSTLPPTPASPKPAAAVEPGAAGPKAADVERGN